MTPTRLQCDRGRRGLAAVEFAVCLPVLVLAVFASIEACTMVFLKESLTVAAYEGSRVALKPGTTEAAVTARCQQVLTERNVAGGTVEIIPGVISAITVGNPLEIRVSAPCEANAIMPVWFYGNSTMSGSSIVMKEY